MQLRSIVGILGGVLFGLISCTGKKSKSDIAVEFVPDTLQVGYTYWWSESGPFLGQCGDELSLVFSGTLTDLRPPTEDAGPLYTSQKGTIEINRVFKIKELEDQTYANQKFILTDCFNGLTLSAGDQVLVFCYDYEGGYTLPGNQSILKISGPDDPLIKSIRTYIDSGQKATTLEEDVGLWAQKGLGRKLQDIIGCEKTVGE